MIEMLVPPDSRFPFITSDKPSSPLANSKIPHKLLKKPKRVTVKSRAKSSYNIAAVTSSLVVFSILAYAFGYILKIF